MQSNPSNTLIPLIETKDNLISHRIATILKDKESPTLISTPSKMNTRAVINHPITLSTIIISIALGGIETVDRESRVVIGGLRN